MYVGQTNNMEKRLREHRSKKKRAAKYTKSFDSITLVYQEQFPSRGEALKREYRLKQLTHAQKETVIGSKIGFH